MKKFVKRVRWFTYEVGPLVCVIVGAIAGYGYFFWK